MIEPIDFPRLETVCWRALCLYDVGLLDFLMASTIIRHSFVLGEPCLRVFYAKDLADITGMSKGKAHGVIKRMKDKKMIEISGDRLVYTFMPPCKAWPWDYPMRADEAVFREVEAGLIWANKGGPRQSELFSPSAEQEFAEALAIERMREALLEYHRAAESRRQVEFPVKDRHPKFLARGEAGPGHHLARPGTLPSSPGELERPPGTGGAEDSPPESFANTEAPASYYWLPDGAGEDFPEENPVPEKGTPVPEKGTPVPEKGTPVPEKGTPFNAFNVSMSSKVVPSTKAVTAFNGRFSKREPHAAGQGGWRAPLSPGATEEEVIRWLRGAFGERVMAQWGGWWRLQIRECRLAVLEAISNYKLRVETRGFPDSPGGWLRDHYFRFRKVIRCSDRMKSEGEKGAN